MTALREAIDTTTLGWIKPELDETLRQARQEIEAFAEDPADASRMRVCANHLHQVHGTLRMVELYAPAMVAEEMERLAIALQQGQVADRDEACAALMRGVVLLPDYLERLQGGHRDIPIVLLPLLNELRATRGESGLNESVLFAPNLDRPLPAHLPPPLPVGSAAGRNASAPHLASLRDALAGWPEDGAPSNPAQLASAIDGLLADVVLEPVRRMLWVASSVAHALRDGALPATRALRQAFGGVDREARQMLSDDGFSAPRGEPAAEPTRQLLYHVAHSDGRHPALDDLRQTFELAAHLPSESELEHARGSLSGRNRALLDTVAAAIKEDLLRVKDALDLHLRTNQTDPGELRPQVDALARVSDTLGMMGLGMARTVVLQQREAMHEIVEGRRAADEGTLLDVAGALLYVDASLDDQVSRLGLPEDKAEENLLAGEARKVLDVVAREAIANFGDARQSFVAFVETKWDHDELTEVPRVLDEVAGALRMIELPLAADYLTGVKRYTEVELIGRRRVPSGQQLDTLADALASLEYYLEALREQRPNRDDILDIARQSLETLRYWPLPDVIRVEPAAEAIPVAATPAVEAAPVDTTASQAPAVDTSTPESAVADSLDLQRSEQTVDAQTVGDAVAADTAEPVEPTLAAASDAATESTATETVASVAAGGALIDASLLNAVPDAPPSMLGQSVATGGFEQVDDIDDEVREIFLEEFEEEIANLDNLLPAWREAPDDLARVQPVRRVFHTLKGSGRLVGARTLGEFSWNIENLLNRVREHGRAASPEVIDLVEHAHRALPGFYAALRNQGPLTVDVAGIEAHADLLATGEEAFYQPPQATAEAEAETAAPVAIDGPYVPASVDPVLLEILDGEVAGHLVTIEAWLAASRSQPQLASDGLQRSIHTLNGAFAMTEVPVITDVTAPTEAYVKRLLASAAPASAEGVAALTAVADAIRTTVEALKSPTPHVPMFVGLPERIAALRDSLPDARSPMITEEIYHDDVLPEGQDLSELTVNDLSAFGDYDPSREFAQVAGNDDASAKPVSRTDFDGDELSLGLDLLPVGFADSTIEAARLEVERAEVARLEAERLEAERIAAEQAEAARLEAERLAAEQAEAARLEAERLAAEQAEAARLEAERLAAEQAEAARLEAERLAAEQAEAERLEAERLAAEQAEAERLEAERLAAEQAEAERLEAERLAAEQAEAERLEAERLAAEQAEAERLEAERLAAEQAEAERIAAEKAEAERLAEEERLEYERLEAEYAAEAQRAEQARLEAEQAEAARLEAERIAAEQTEAERLEAERIAAEQAEAERLEAERIAAEQAEAERLQAERIAAEQAEAERLEAERIAAEQAEAERLEAERIAAERAEAERLEYERLEAEYAEAERLAREQAEAEAEAQADAEQPATDLAQVRLDDRGTDSEAAANDNDEAPSAEVERPAAALVAGASTAVQTGIAAGVPAALAAIFAHASNANPDPEEALDVSELDPELVDIFVEEGGDLLDHSDGLLAQLRETPSEREPLVGLQRDLHTLKGGARMAGIMAVGELGHVMESLLEAVVDHRTELGRDGLVLLERGFDRLHAMVTRVGTGRAIAMPEALISVFEARWRGEAMPSFAGLQPAEVEAAQPQAQAQAQPVAAEHDGLKPLSAPIADAPLGDEDEIGVRAPQEQVRIRADLLDRLVNYAGEVAIYRARLEQQLGAFRGAIAEMAQTNLRMRDQLRRLEIETEAQIIARYQREGDSGDQSFDPLELDRFSTLQQLSRALTESAADQNSLQNTLDDLTRQYETLLLQQSRVSSELQEGLMRTRMVPFDTLLPRLRRVVRQASSELGKQVTLKLEGTQGELDRNVLERMTAPLEHMLRNAVAHGLERPEQRRAAGKPDEGTVRIAVRREGSEVVLEVADDGAGLDRAAIRRRGEERGLVRADAVIAEADLDSLILEPGFSTADEVSRLAGRGVGMDVVASEVRQLGGTLDIHSRPGQGVHFTLRLPQTLAVTQAVFVRIGDITFAVPIASVRGVGRLSRELLDAGEASYRYGGEDYVVHDLGTLIGHAPAKAEGQLQMPLLLIRSGDLRAAITIDQVIGNREIVVKPVGPQVASVPGIFGATIMGDGRVVVILDVAPLVRRRTAQLLDFAQVVAPPPAPAETRRVPLVMVVDDSVTMRKVTGRVLERHNFEVITAKDGIDALERMAERVPDLMLLDIEMPRMDGYELATQMKADARMREVPIVMITSRTGEKHRQRAFEIGVERYLGKPYQELELIRNVFELLGIARHHG
ncbi:histidine kinase-, DNA gyrase B-, and HSP90-like ATPase family protein [Lysobacter antibioticus]|uniref:Hpt domain-containing protein n=1 Tax=Lysobacter antibioticus TaxID=84531 RepID=UPI00071701B1|nr:Hpt domain-containing protein [Lysobacter antibioticus]ALN65516.1 histidine kinase-, DNA gyrase B-, and HSP90-like ATPase family protein [Lysobacter antibioticus]